MQGPWNTYQRIVLEVLSTAKVTRDRNKEPTGVTFQLMNEEYTLSVEDINRIFQVPQNGQYQMPYGCDHMEFWSAIASPSQVPYVSNTAKASSIRNPVFRYVQRSLASTVLARTDQGGVRVDELDIMWCMLNGYNVNFAQFFLSQLAGQTKQRNGKITIGALLTPIAIFL